MGVEVFPDSPSLGMSPRISFSHDLPQNDTVPVEHYIRSSSTSSSTIDFDFCVFRESFDQQSSSADELFFDGKILPIEIKKRLSPLPPPQLLLQPPPPPEFHESRRPIEEKQNYKATSFWGFKRSTSLNCGSGYASTLCPLPLLSRSNSAGSTSSSVKRSSVSNNQKQNSLKHQLPNSSLKPTSHQKPPLKKSSYNNNSSSRIKINPVLNVPPANLFGFASFFSGGKDKTKKK